MQLAAGYDTTWKVIDQVVHATKNTSMKQLIAALFIIPGLINFAPILGVLSNEHLAKLYLVNNLNPDIALLLRHRALLFGIVGAFIFYSAFQTHLRTYATIAGLVSMVSFVILVFTLNTSNPSLIKVAWIDVGAIIILIAGYLLHMGWDAH